MSDLLKWQGSGKENEGSGTPVTGVLSSAQVQLARIKRIFVAERGQRAQSIEHDSSTAFQGEALDDVNLNGVLNSGTR